MKLTVIALALAATTFAANAQTTIITEERAPSAVIVAPEPSVSTTVTTKEHGGLLGTEFEDNDNHDWQRLPGRLLDPYRSQGRPCRREDRHQDKLSVT